MAYISLLSFFLLFSVTLPVFALSPAPTAGVYLTCGDSTCSSSCYGSTFTPGACVPSPEQSRSIVVLCEEAAAVTMVFNSLDCTGKNIFNTTASRHCRGGQAVLCPNQGVGSTDYVIVSVKNKSPNDPFYGVGSTQEYVLNNQPAAVLQVEPNTQYTFIADQSVQSNMFFELTTSASGGDNGLNNINNGLNISTSEVMFWTSQNIPPQTTIFYQDTSASYMGNKLNFVAQQEESVLEQSNSDPCTLQAGPHLFEEAMACINSIPFNETVRSNTLDSISSTLELYTFLDEAISVPASAAGLSIVPVDLRQEIARIRTAQYANDLAFHQDLAAVFTSLKDAHTRYIPPASYRRLVNFIQPLFLVHYVDVDTDVVGVSLDTLPSGGVNWFLQKFGIDLSIFVNATVLTIDNSPAFLYLHDFANKQLGLCKDGGTRLNLAFSFNLPEPGLNGDFFSKQAPIFGLFSQRNGDFAPYPDSPFVAYEIQLANGTVTQVNLPWVAFINANLAGTSDFMHYYYNSQTDLEAYIERRTRNNKRPSNSHQLSQIYQIMKDNPFVTHFPESTPHSNPQPVVQSVPTIPASSSSSSTHLANADDLLSRPTLVDDVDTKANTLPLPQNPSRPQQSTIKAKADLLKLKEANIIPLVNDTVSAFSYLLANSQTYVIYLNTFEPANGTNFLNVVSQSIEKAYALGYTRLILDLSSNGGGDICLGRRFLQILFQNGVLPYPPTNMPSSVLAQTMTSNAASYDLENANWSPSSYNNYFSNTQYAANDSSWLFNGTSFTRNGHTRMYSQLVYLSEETCAYDPIVANPPPAYMLPQKITILTRGACGSTCAYVSQHASHYEHVETVVVGGVFNVAQQFLSFPGLQVIDINDMMYELNFYLTNPRIAQPSWQLVPNPLITSAIYRYCIREIYIDSSYWEAGADPSEYTFMPADRRIYDTWLTVNQPELLWLEI